MRIRTVKNKDGTEYTEEYQEVVDIRTKVCSLPVGAKVKLSEVYIFSILPEDTVTILDVYLMPAVRLNKKVITHAGDITNAARPMLPKIAAVKSDSIIEVDDTKVQFVIRHMHPTGKYHWVRMKDESDYEW